MLKCLVKECIVPLAQKGLKLETAEPKKIFAYFCVSEYCAAFLSFLSRKEQINNILWWPHMIPYARVWGSLIHNCTRICLCLNQPQFLWHSTKFSDLVHIQPVSDKRYFRCNNCFLLSVYTIYISLEYKFGKKKGRRGGGGGSTYYDI
jgi:hypothetical protein